jgi:hypothetical protein
MPSLICGCVWYIVQRLEQSVLKFHPHIYVNLSGRKSLNSKVQLLLLIVQIE